MPPPPYGWSLSLLCAVMPLALGCAPLQLQTAAKTPLSQPKLSPGAVVLDIYFIRFPFADAEANDPSEYIQFTLPPGGTFHVLEALRSAGCTKSYQYTVDGSGTATNVTSPVVYRLRTSQTYGL